MASELFALFWPCFIWRIGPCLWNWSHQRKQRGFHFLAYFHASMYCFTKIKQLSLNLPLKLQLIQLDVNLGEHSLPALANNLMRVYISCWICETAWLEWKRSFIHSVQPAGWRRSQNAAQFGRGSSCFGGSRQFHYFPAS